jgi:hypothetical protein
MNITYDSGMMGNNVVIPPRNVPRGNPTEFLASSDECPPSVEMDSSDVTPRLSA